MPSVKEHIKCHGLKGKLKMCGVLEEGAWKRTNKRNRGMVGLYKRRKASMIHKV
jgi:hypothetical protein